MEYLSVEQTAKRWNVSERSVRNYCSQGRIEGAFLSGKTWSIPEAATKPERMNRTAPPTLLSVMQAEKSAKISGGIYHKVQIELTYNSNRIEGSSLTQDQTRYIYETNTIDSTNGAIDVDDIVETAQHFRCVDLIIDHARDMPSEKLILQLHAILMSGTTDSRKGWAIGEYKRLPNEVGSKQTTLPEDVSEQMTILLKEYNSTKAKTLEDIIDFHYRFEAIHPFQDGNGRVGRLIMFKECMKNGIVPFIINDSHKMYYYRGLQEWTQERGYLIDTCLAAQDNFKQHLDYFRIAY